MVTYDELCTAIIRNKVSSIGKDRALECARSTGLAVDDAGAAQGSDLGALTKLTEAYRGITGKIGVVFARGAIQSLIRGQNIEIPDILK